MCKSLPSKVGGNGRRSNKTVGRVSYVKLTLTQGGIPVSNAQIGLMYKESGQWKTFTDPLTKKEIFTTDKNGVVMFSVFSKKETDLQFLAYLIDDQSIKTQFRVSFKKPQWLFTIWICADNNLEGFGFLDKEEMKNVNNNVSVFLVCDVISEQDSLYVMDELGEWIEIMVFQQDLDSCNSSLLLEVLKVLFGPCEANNYSLILWDHGGAWIDDSIYTCQITPHYIAIDDTSNHAISTRDLRKALEDFSTQTGKKIKLLGMDACLMGSIEVLYELRGVVDYVVASSSIVPGNGCNYEFFKQISPTDDAVSVGKKIVDTYKDYYKTSSDYKQRGLTFAVYDMSKVLLTALCIDDLAKSLYLKMNDDLRNVINNFYPRLVEYSSSLIDLNDFTEFVKSNVNGEYVKYYAQQIQIALSELIVYEYSEKTNYEIQNPVSIFMPGKKDFMLEYRADYETLSFSELSWFDFLESWLR